MNFKQTAKPHSKAGYIALASAPDSVLRRNKAS